MNMFGKVLLAVRITAMPFVATNADDNIDFTLTSAIISKYTAFGGGTVLCDAPAIQTGLTISSSSNGWYGGVWNSRGFEGKLNDSYCDEIDIFVGYADSIGDWSYDASLTYFDEPDLFDFGAGDILYTHLTVSRPINDRFTLNLDYQGFSTMPDSGIEGGSLFGVGVSTFSNFNTEKWTIDASAYIVYDDGGFREDDGFFGRGSVGVGYKVSDSLTLDLVRANWYAMFGVDDTREDHVVYFTGITYSF